MASRKRTEPAQDDLFNPEVELLLPARLAIEGKVLGSPIRQLVVPPLRVRCRLRPFSIRRVTGHETTLPTGETLKILNAKTATSLEADLILLVPGASEPAQIAKALDAGEGRWMTALPIRIDMLNRQARVERLAEVSASWLGAFHLREGRAAESERPAQPGLRRPQIGALHAALAHATRSSDPATIVMPTGTGKTETMLALNAHQRFERLLVVVPTDALREQIAGKFETFGVLRQQQCLEDKAVFPVVMRPRQISERPHVPPVAIHWPESLLTQIEDRIEISFGDEPVAFAECDIELLDHERTGPLRFAVRSDTHIAEFEVVFAEGVARYPQRSGPKTTIKVSGKVKPLSESFGEDSPQIDFGDGSLLIYSHLYALPEGVVVEPYPNDRIEAWDWSKTNIRAEAQGPEKRADSVQRRVIETLLAERDAYDLIFDDDGAGEIADVVTLRVTEGLVQVTLHHCKYSSSDTPGTRVKDLYEVCGQAQKSARWRDRPNRMFIHMLKREKLRFEKGQTSRFEHGTAAFLKKLKASWQDYRYEFDVRIVQPGLSRAAVTEEGLHLLASVETYLLETRAMRLKVIASS
ncbi:DEAD/DEAH box helicase family protein [Labrenzia sp. ac12]